MEYPVYFFYESMSLLITDDKKYFLSLEYI